MAKVYTEKEAAEILQRAAALQETSSEPGGTEYTPGITAEELRRIAEESGIDVQFLDRALTDGPPPVPQKTVAFNLIQEHERVIDGEVSPHNFDKLLEAIGPSAGRSSGVRQVGRTLEGQFAKGFGFGYLRISPRHGRTRLFVRSNCFIPIMTMLYPCSLAGVIGGINLLARGIIWPGLAALIGLPLIGLFMFRFGQKKCHADAAKFVAELERVINEEVDMPSASKALDAEPARLNLVE